MKMYGHVLWGKGGKNRVLLMSLPLGGRGYSCLNVRMFVLDSLWASFVILEWILLLSLVFFFPFFSPLFLIWWWWWWWWGGVATYHDGT